MELKYARIKYDFHGCADYMFVNARADVFKKSLFATRKCAKCSHSRAECAKYFRVVSAFVRVWIFVTHSLFEIQKQVSCDCVMYYVMKKNALTRIFSACVMYSIT